MDSQTIALKGSPHRDAFKHWHKTLRRSFYGCDLDFIWIEKNPPRIVGAVDYKRAGEGVTFAEVVAYNALIQNGIPVYLVSTSPPMPPYKRLTVREYIGGNWKPNPPTYEVSLILNGATPAEFEEWQASLRRYQPAIVEPDPDSTITEVIF